MLGTETVMDNYKHSILSNGIREFLGPVWNAGISQESHMNFTGISSISQEKRRNGEKISHSKQALTPENKQQVQKRLNSAFCSLVFDYVIIL